MRKFVEDERDSIGNGVPGQHKSAFTPGFTEPGFIAFLHDSAAQVAGSWDDVHGRVNEDRYQMRVIIGFAMEQEQARLGGDANFVLFFNDESAAAFELFFCQKN